MTAYDNKDLSWLDEWMEERDVTLWGAADLSDFSTPPDETGRRLPKAISFAIPMDPNIMVTIQNGPTHEYTADYIRVNNRINALSIELAAEIRSRGFYSFPMPASERTDKVNIKGDFPQKTVATRAGLGWIGRNCQLVSKEFGPWLRLGTVFTDLDIECGPAIEQCYCGNCHRCIDACPSRALKNNVWYPGVPRNELLDVFVCDQWKIEHYYEFYNGHNCGICAAVCPLGLKQLER